MATLTKDDVLKLAKLAKLSLSADEVELFAQEISEILKYVEQLNSAALEGIEPAYQVTGLANVTRPDEILDYGATPEQLLANVPAIDNGQIKVKKIL